MAAEKNKGEWLYFEFDYILQTITIVQFLFLWQNHKWCRGVTLGTTYFILVGLFVCKNGVIS